MGQVENLHSITFDHSMSSPSVPLALCWHSPLFNLCSRCTGDPHVSMREYVFFKNLRFICHIPSASLNTQPPPATPANSNQPYQHTQVISFIRPKVTSPKMSQAQNTSQPYVRRLLGEATRYETDMPLEEDERTNVYNMIRLANKSLSNKNLRAIALLVATKIQVVLSTQDPRSYLGWPTCLASFWNTSGICGST